MLWPGLLTIGIYTTRLPLPSGEKTKSERQGVGDEEFCPWQIGPTF